MYDSIAFSMNIRMQNKSKTLYACLYVYVCAIHHYYQIGHISIIMVNQKLRFLRFMNKF